MRFRPAVAALAFVLIGAESAPPVEIELLVDGIYAVGGQLVVTCTATPQIDAERMTVALEIPDGMTVLAGQPTWEGAGRKGTEAVLEVSVRVDQPGFRTIAASVSLVVADGARLTRRVAKAVQIVPHGR